MGTMCVHTHTDMYTHSHTNSIHTPERKGRERGGGRRVGGGGRDEGGGNLFKGHLPAFREIHILLISI